MASRRTRLVVSLGLIFSTTAVFAGMDEMSMSETKFMVKGDFRWRAEVDGKDFNSDTDPQSFSVLRARLGASLSRGNIGAYVQLQVPETLDWNSSTIATHNAFDVHQAYLKYHHLCFDPLMFKVGRFEMKYGDERFIGTVGWSNIGRVFDGAVFRWDAENYWVDAFFTQQKERSTAFSATTPQTNAPDDGFYGIWGEWKPLKLNVFVLEQTGADTTAAGLWVANMSRMTLGTYYANDYESGFGTVFNFAYQMGTMKGLIPTRTSTDLAAWMFAVEVNYKLEAMWSPKLGVGVDWTTGDDPSTPEYEAFDDLYYTGHKFRGSMDYFTGANPTGLHDIFVKVNTMPSDKYKLNLAVHMFSMDQPAAAGGSAKSLGNEIDLEGGYMMDEWSGLDWGIGYFMPTDDFVANGDSGMWAYLQLHTMFKWGEMK